MEVTKCVKFQIPRYKGFKVGIFRISPIMKLGMEHYELKDLYSTAQKRGSVFIGLMTPDGAIWSRYQRTVLMR